MTPKKGQHWSNRIVGHDLTAPDQLLANPLNFRVHPKPQQQALAGVLGEIGWIQSVIVNQRTGHVVDGHLRVQLALSRGEAEIPVVYVDLDDAEERLALATIDPLAAMATTDTAQLDALLQGVSTTDTAVQEMLADLAEQTCGLGLEDAETVSSRSLADCFVVPPFSVLDTRQGYWQDRKRAWLSLGILSELGRGETGVSTPGTGQATDRRAADQRSNLTDAPPLPEWAGNGMANMAPGTSIFDPVLCELAYLWFSPAGGQVLDPFAGGSVRGIVASRLGRQYTGVDLSAGQVQANQRQALTICRDAQPRWTVGDSQAIAELAPGAYDLVFSCPPYADLEVYSDDPRDLSRMPYDDFLAAYRRIIAASVGMLRNDRFACFVVGDVRDRAGNYRNFVSDTISAFLSAGARLYNEAILVNQAGTLPIRARRLFESSRKLGKTHQNVLVFVKGDARRATEACGPVDAIWTEPPSNDEERA